MSKRHSPHVGLVALLPLTLALGVHAGDHPACPSDGDCTIAHNTPGCDDIECCNAVCDVDAFCCRVQWDSLCADEAIALCQPVCNAKPCASSACSSDLNADGSVNAEDLGILLGAWGTSPGACPDFNCDGTVGASDLGILLGDWSTTGSLFATCTSNAILEDEPCGTDVNGGCNAPDCSGSDCCTAHPRPGCADPDCEAILCSKDSFCCDAAWDAVCAAAACELCTGSCTPVKPPVTPIECGDTICGTAWALDGVRDTDWFELDLSGRRGTCRITATLSASFPATTLLIVDDQCDPFTLGAGDDNCPNVATACIDPAVHPIVRIVVAQGVFNGFPCESGQVEYLLTVNCECEGGCEPAACGVPGAGDCCTPHPTPFCDDAECCDFVCNIVPFCCQVEWDANCVFWAVTNCADCQVPGACCLPDGSCIQVSGPAECHSQAGDFLGAGSDCFTIRCPVICGPGAGDCCADGGHPGPGCDDAACCTAVCVPDPFCCNFQWDASCAEEAEELCAVCGLTGACCLKDGTCVDVQGAAACEALGGSFIGALTSCATFDCTPICGPGAGSCFKPHETPGCEDASCCFTVCAIDPWCCDVNWDSICADEASSYCINCGEPTDGPTCTGTDEGEACGTDTNGGCNSERPVFGAIACGETICGTAWAEGKTRDTDWFSFTVSGELNQTVIATLEADFSNATLVILDANCKPSTIAIGEGNCVTVVTACLPPGDYRLFVSQGVFDGFPCEGGAINYALTLECLDEPCMSTGCGSPGTGDCCSPQRTPFCSDSECCDAICRSDPHCCDVAWDQECADQAGALCSGCS